MKVKIRWDDDREEILPDVREIHFNHNGKGDIAFESEKSGMNTVKGRVIEFEAFDE